MVPLVLVDSETGVVVTGLVVTGLVVIGLVVVGVVVGDPADVDLVGSTMEVLPVHAASTKHTVTGMPIFVRIREAFIVLGNLT